MVIQSKQGEQTMSSQTNPNTQAVFDLRYQMVCRDEIVGIMLALFLGSFGAHHFYLRRTGLGILYCFFFWTGLPGLLGFIECFFMAGRVREFNAIQAAGIAAVLGIPAPPWSQPWYCAANVPPAAQTGTLVACARCGRANAEGARFCSGCGAALA
jgi:TM2 domain-containing membrane protein YozV